MLRHRPIVAFLVFASLSPVGCLDFDQFLQDVGVAMDVAGSHDAGATDVGEPRRDAGEDDGPSAPDAADAGPESGVDSGADAEADSGQVDGGDTGVVGDAGDDGGTDSGTDGGADAGEEYTIRQASVYQTAAGACSNDEFDLTSATGWDARTQMENDEFVSSGKVLFLK